MKQITERQYVATPVLKETIEAQGRLHSWIAERAGVSKFHFSHVLAGTRTLTNQQADAVASALGVPLFLLFELRDSSKYMRDRISSVEVST